MTAKESQFRDAVNALLENSATQDQKAFIETCCLEDRSFTRLYLAQMDTFRLLDLYLPSQAKCLEARNRRQTVLRWTALAAGAAILLAGGLLASRQDGGRGKKADSSAKALARSLVTKKVKNTAAKALAERPSRTAAESGKTLVREKMMEETEMAFSGEGRHSPVNGEVAQNTMEQDKMKTTNNVKTIVAGMAAAAIAAIPAMADVTNCQWLVTTGVGFWTNSANWADGRIPQAGDSVALPVASNKWTDIYLQNADPLTLAKISCGAGDGMYWSLIGSETVTMTGGAEIDIPDYGVTLNTYCTLAGTQGILKTGAGTLKMMTNNVFTGQFKIANGRVIAKTDATLGQEPATLDPAAILLDGGALGNDSESFAVAPTRGISVTNTAYLFGRSNPFTIASPICGKGNLAIINQTAAVILANTNSYEGETIIGSTAWWPFGGATATLVMGTNGALPSATTLSFTDSLSLLSLNGYTQRVAHVSTSGFPQISGPGTLAFGENDTECAFSLNLLNSPVLECEGTGTFTPTFKAGSTGTLVAQQCLLNLTNGNALAAVTLSLGGSMQVAGTVSSLPQNIHLTANAGLLISAPLSLTGDITSDLDENGDPYTLTVTSGNASPLFFGNATQFAELGAKLVNETGGVVITNRAHLGVAQSAGVAIARNAIVYGPGASALSQGDQSIDNEAVCLTVGRTFGDAASVNVTNGGLLCLYSTTNARTTLTIPYQMAVDGASSLTFAGAGVVACTGKITGSGTLRVENGTTLDLSGADISEFTGSLQADSGILQVADGVTETLSMPAAGSLGKIGGGTLVLNGAAANLLTLTVKEGTARLASTSGCAVSNVTVSGSALLALDADHQVSDQGTVALLEKAVWDLNGHSETVKLFTCLSSAAAIVNNASGDSTLGWTDRSVTCGKMLESPGKIHLVQSGGKAYLIGPCCGTNDFRVSDFAIQAGNVIPYSQYTTVTFTFYRARQDNIKPALAEITLTQNGVPVETVPNTLNVSSTYSGYTTASLCDGFANTVWKANATNATITLGFSSPIPFNGYLFCTADSSGSDPIDWDVSVGRSDGISILVDQKRNVLFARSAPMAGLNNYNYSSNFTFNAASAPDGAIFKSVPLNVEGTLRVSGSTPLETDAMTGNGVVAIEDGSDFEPANLSDFGGKLSSTVYGNTTLDKTEGTVFLNSQTGAAEQPVRIQTDGSGDIAVMNATTNPVDVLLDNTYTNGNFAYGRFSDGAGKLGLVKRGSGTVVLGNGHGDYTGDTRIKEGTLAVRNARGITVKASYVRFTPKAMSGADSNKAPWGSNEFYLLFNGQHLAWPAGTTLTCKNFNSTPAANLIDGNIGTRYLGSWENGNTDLSVTFNLGSPVTFDAYEYYTPAGNAADANRIPTAWTLEASNDGSAWTTVDRRSGVAYPAYANPAVSRGVYSLDDANVPKSGQTLLPAVYAAGTNGYSTSTSRLIARYFRFNPFRVANFDKDSWAFSGWQATEFLLSTNGVARKWMSNATIASRSDPFNAASSAQNLIDNILDSANGQNRFYSYMLPNLIDINAQTGLEFDAYGYVTPPNTLSRSPTGWKFYISNDKANWMLVDVQTNVLGQIPQDISKVAGPWPIKPFPIYSSDATDAISDNSKVVIDSGASLLLNTRYEKTGSAEGTGKVTLGNAIWEINGTQNAAFGGALEGNGVLAKSGAATQTLTGASSFVGKLQVKTGALEIGGATLGGVTNLLLQGGVLQGASPAVLAGNVTATFDGGIYDANCSMTGSLTVTGKPAFLFPSNAKTPYVKRLFTYADIDAASALLLKNATISGTLPRGDKATIKVGAKYCELRVSAKGTVVMLK